jgi:hypothetical protein
MSYSLFSIPAPGWSAGAACGGLLQKDLPDRAAFPASLPIIRLLGMSVKDLLPICAFL